MRATGWVVIGLVTAAAGAGGYYALREEPVVPEKVTTTKVKRSTVIKKVRGVGHVEPVTQVKVSANVSGDLIKLTVADGDKVKRGQLLAEIDPEQLAAIVRQNEAGTKSQQAAVALEQAQLDRARSELERTKKLHGQGLVTDTEIDQQKAEVQVIEARLEAARQRVLQSEAALDEARSRLTRTRVFAPIDGTVISLRKKEGEKIRGSDLAEDILLVLAPLQAMQVLIEVSEQDVVGVAVGQTAEITVDALGRDATNGKVVEIANSAIIRNQGTEAETTSFSVKVALDQIPERLRSGMSASVAIITDTKENVLAVPIEAVTARLPSELEKRAEDAKKGGKTMFSGQPEAQAENLRLSAKRDRPVEVVFVAENGKAEPRRVKTGISSDTDLELLEGVKEGDEVIVGPYKTLSRTLMPGTPLDVQKDEPVKAVAGS
ncbi:efflux RND transporter periplasmic adaptor subunit [Myxococcota bacterium]|nr:efflux RND transporter periplasmic adaptor subunit [Myxococcota bacterium]